MRPLTRLTRDVVVVSVFLASFVSVNRSEPAAADHLAALTNHITWNMCNGVSAPCGNSGGIAPAQEMHAMVAYSPVRPVGISTQEMCQASWQYLRDELGADFGYSRWFYVSNPNTNSNCQVHMNGAFWAGGCYNGFPNCIISETWSAQTGEPDLRGVICGRAAFPAFITCSSHLTHQNDSVALAQAREWASLVNFLNALGVRSYAGGDFNVTPSQVSSGASAWPADYDEGDQGRNRATHQSAGKIDYIWLREGTQCITHGAFISNADRSDHHQYRAYFTGC